jgi:hypothetical protein
MLNLRKLRSILTIFICSLTAFNTYSGNPVAKLQDFDLLLKKNKIFLSWKTNYEEGTKGFLIQKSTDGVNFTKVTFEKAKGQYNSGAYYEVQEKNAGKIAIFYQLVEITHNNQEVVLKTINPTAVSEDFSLKMEASEIQETLTFVCKAAMDKTGILRIINEKNDVVLIEQPILKKGENPFSIDLSWIPAGKYFLKVVIEKQELLTQFSKK